MLVKVKVKERPKTVTVEYNGQTHTARWNNDAEVFDAVGDRLICKAAMEAWNGEKAFELEDTELAKRSHGWWSVGDTK